MVICDYCNKPISSWLYWNRYRNGKKVFVCNKCAANLINDQTINGLLLVIDNKNRKGKK